MKDNEHIKSKITIIIKYANTIDTDGCVKLVQG